MDEGEKKGALILAAVLLGSMSAGMARPAIALLVRYSLGAAMLATASLISGFMAGRASMSVVAGVLGDIDPGRRRLLASIPLYAAAVVLFLLPYSKTPLAYIIGMTIWGVMAGLAWPTAQTLIADASSRSGTMLSLYFATGTAGIALGNWLFGYLPLSLPGAVRIGGLLLAAAGVLLSTASEGLSPAVKRGKTSLGELRGVVDSRIAWILFSAFTAGFLVGLLREYFYVVVYEDYGLTKQQLGSLLSLGSIAALGGGLLVGPLSDRIGVQRALLMVLATGLTASLLLTLDSSLYITAAGFLLAMVTGRSSLPLTRNASILGVGRGGSTVVGLSNTLSNLGNMTSPLLAGALYTLNTSIAGIPGKNLAYLIAFALILTSILWYLLISRK